MKIGLAQINTTVGDLQGNKAIILDAYQRLCQHGADIVLFPELAITGYPPRDLIFRESFVKDNREALESLLSQIDKVPAVVGFIDTEQVHDKPHYFNAAAWCEKGQILYCARKCLLPNYDIFDEPRYFQAAKEPIIVTFQGQRIGLTICEDIWTDYTKKASIFYPIDPIKTLAEKKIDLMLNLSASPWDYGKTNIRAQQIKRVAQHCHCPVIYCNAVGANDEIIFDGQSLVADNQGKIVDQLAGFEEAFKMIDTHHLGGSAPLFSYSEQEEAEKIYNALVLGVRDYAHKSGFHCAALGLSGGIDSAVTAVIAVEALGAENIIGLSLPSSISSQHSREDAHRLAQNLGIRYHQVPIKEMVSIAEKSLYKCFSSEGCVDKDITEENLQARSRGMLLMALSNKLDALLLATGNKSELAVGYCTLYGDMCGGLAVLSDVLKTDVYALANWINRKKEIIPYRSITKHPSAELRPGQKDEDTLPPYSVLDPILEKYIEKNQSPQAIIAEGFDQQIVDDVIRRVNLNEYKRKQMPTGLKVTPLAWGTGRRLPIVQKYQTAQNK